MIKNICQILGTVRDPWLLLLSFKDIIFLAWIRNRIELKRWIGIRYEANPVLIWSFEIAQIYNSKSGCKNNKFESYFNYLSVQKGQKHASLPHVRSAKKSRTQT
jgi:hypothetical protein